jgi:UDP-2,3-diacylglucosamine pyrophosphatase LpxH
MAPAERATRRSPERSSSCSGRLRRAPGQFFCSFRSRVASIAASLLEPSPASHQTNCPKPPALYPALVPSTLVISDLHLHPFKTPSESSPSYRGAQSLLRLLARYPEANLTLAGDIFDLTLWNTSCSVEGALSEFKELYPELFRELGLRVARGQALTLVPGNHDAILAEPESRAAFSRVLGSQNAQVSPWFQRISSTHIEHGNQFDVDNAFVHPLAPHNPATEPLGTALMRRFVGPSNAHVFAHGNTTTLTSGLRLAVKQFGARAPLVVGRYFVSAASLLVDAAFRKEIRAQEQQLGHARIAARALETGLTEGELERLAAACPSPRHNSFRETWMRLYFDRVLAAGTAGAAIIAALPPSGNEVTARAALLTSLAYLGVSVLHRPERYGVGPSADLGRAAQQIRETTGAKLVVMGHTHQPHQEEGYVNLGSFTFAREARHYVLLDERGNFESGQSPL